MIKCVYMESIDKGYVIIYLYMDNMLILGSINHIIKYTKKILTNKLDIKDLGVANVILGIKFWRYLMDWYCLNLIMLRKFSKNFIAMTIALSKHQLI